MATDNSDNNETGVLFILYIKSKTPNSIQAEANLRAMCQSNFPEYDIEVIDVLKNPERALADGIIVTPTLVKVAPVPQQVIMGNLSDTARVLKAVKRDGSKEGQQQP
jgi:circadian clock protein KaiB